MKSKSIWKNESANGVVVEQKAPGVCQNCEGGLIVNTSVLGGFERCPVCGGTGIN